MARLRIPQAAGHMNAEDLHQFQQPPPMLYFQPPNAYYGELPQNQLSQQQRKFQIDPNQKTMTKTLSKNENGIDFKHRNISPNVAVVDTGKIKNAVPQPSPATVPSGLVTLPYDVFLQQQSFNPALAEYAFPVPPDLANIISKRKSGSNGKQINSILCYSQNQHLNRPPMTSLPGHDQHSIQLDELTLLQTQSAPSTLYVPLPHPRPEFIEPVKELVRRRKNSQKYKPTEVKLSMSTHDRYENYQHQHIQGLGSEKNIPRALEFKPYTYTDYESMRSQQLHNRLATSLGPTIDEEYHKRKQKVSKMHEYASRIRSNLKMRSQPNNVAASPIHGSSLWQSSNETQMQIPVKQSFPQQLYQSPLFQPQQFIPSQFQSQQHQQQELSQQYTSQSFGQQQQHFVRPIQSGNVVMK